MTPPGELDLRLPAPKVSPERVQRLIEILRFVGDWRTADELAALLGPRVSDRSVRAAASVACPQIVSYPGSPGYKLWQLCSLEEINHCIESFECQGKDMLKRAVLYRQAYYRRFRGAPEDAQ